MYYIAEQQSPHGPLRKCSVSLRAARVRVAGIFDGKNCNLATRIVQILPAVVDALPACLIRPTCRWYQQEGRAACMRCPQVVTENYEPSEDFKRAALG